jgi:hypothetical protein
MKKLIFVLSLTIALLFSEVAETQFIFSAQGNKPPVEIQSPQAKTYSTNTVAVDIFAIDGSSALEKITYQLDGETEVLVYAYPKTPTMGGFSHMGTGNATLHNLPDGPHYLIAIATWTWWTPGYGHPKTFSQVNFTVDTTQLGVSIDSPLNITYNKSTVPLSVSANKTVSLVYSLDGQPNVNLSTNGTLSGLTDGSHNLLVKTTDAPGNSVFDRVYFVVDTQMPTIANTSVTLNPQNASEALLNFRTNIPVSWMGYCLDYAAKVTITGNTTLTGLSSGKHSITIFANDTAGNTESSPTITFTVPEPFPTTIAIVAVAMVVVIGIGLFVFFKKQHKALSPTAGLANIPA